MTTSPAPRTVDWHIEEIELESNVRERAALVLFVLCGLSLIAFGVWEVAGRFEAIAAALP